MDALLLLLRKYYHWLLLVVLEAVSVVMLVSFNSYQHSVWMTAVGDAVGWVDAQEQHLLDYIHLGENNAELTQRNVWLEQQNALLRHRVDILSRGKSYAEQRQDSLLQGINMIPAKVVSGRVGHQDGFMTIDVGSADGVEPEMGVVCGTGVVGIVSMVSEHYALVMTALHSRSHISCRLRHTAFFGYLRWDGRHPLYAYLDDLPRHARFEVGDAVETSGFSSVFPPGIFMGKVAAVENSEDGLSYSLKVHLSMDLSRVQDVCVIAQQFGDELQELEQHAGQ